MLLGKRSTFHRSHVLEAKAKIIKAIAALSRELGKDPNIEDISVKSRLPLKRVRKIMKVFDTTISIETPIGEDGSKLGDLIADPDGISPLTEVVRTCLEEEVDRVLSTLSPKEEKVIRMRLGIGEKDECTLQEVGEVFRTDP